MRPVKLVSWQAGTFCFTTRVIGTDIVETNIVGDEYYNIRWTFLGI